MYVDRQWYVGESGGRVAVFRGIPAEFAGLHFSHPVVITEIPAADAEAISFYAQLPEGLTANDREAALHDRRPDPGRRGRGRGAPADDGRRRLGVRVGWWRWRLGRRWRWRRLRRRWRLDVSATALPRRRTGLWLLLATLVIALGAYVNVGLAKRGQVPVDLALYGTIMAVGYLGCWLVIRRYARGADPTLFPLGGLLAGLGFAVIFRLDGGLAAEQITWLMVALAAFAITLVLIRDDRQFEGLTYTIGLAALVLLILPVVPGIGTTINGAQLWIQAGPLTFQPSEIGKVLMVLFLASYLTAKRELLSEGVGRFGLPRVKDLGPMLLAWGASLVVLFAEKDLGASLLYFGIFVVMLWLATGRLSYLAIGIVLFAVGAYAGYLLFGHVQLRVDYWLHALDGGNPYKQGFGQLAQGWFGMSTRRAGGPGLGQGSPWLIPYAETDFIFAAIGEELGFLGTAAVLLLYVTLIGRGMRSR